MPRMSLSFMINSSSPSSVISVPDHLPEQDLVASFFDVHRNAVAAFVTCAPAPTENNFALCRLLFCAVGDDQTTCGLLFGFNTADQYPVMQRSECHLCRCRPVALATICWRRCPPTSARPLRDAANRLPFANGILWRAERGSSVIHLVGTLHSPDPRHDRTLARVKPLIDRAASVFLEFGDGDEARLQARMASDPGSAFIVDGPTLPEILPQADWLALRAAMSDRGVPGFMVAKMQPWMAMVTLGMSKCALQQALNKQRGLDQMILDYAGEIGNPARALEPFDTVLTLFNEHTLQEQLDLLRLSLNMEDADPEDQFTTVVEAYFRGEIRLIWEYGVHMGLEGAGVSRAEVLADAARMEDTMVTRRNRQWMTRILPATDAGEVFIAVGALHLPGKNGLL